MSEQTVLLIALLAFLVLVLAGLPAVLFTRLAVQALELGSQAVQKWLDSQHQLTSSLTEMVTNGKSQPAPGTPTTPETPTGTTTE